jgi:hypothetical protein
LPEGAAQLVNESCDTGREAEWAHVLRDIVFKILLYMLNQRDYLSCTLGKTRSRRRGNQLLPTAHEELGVEFIGEFMKL